MTVRKRLYELIDSLLLFCRDCHDRTSKVIKFFNKIPEHDTELLKFFNKCSEECYGPRSSKIFDKDSWPDLLTTTSDDENNELIETLLKHEKNFPLAFFNRIQNVLVILWL